MREAALRVLRVLLDIPKPDTIRVSRAQFNDGGTACFYLVQDKSEARGVDEHGAPKYTSCYIVIDSAELESIPEHELAEMARREMQRAILKIQAENGHRD